MPQLQTASVESHDHFHFAIMKKGQLIKVQPSLNPYENDQDGVRDLEEIKVSTNDSPDELEGFAPKKFLEDQGNSSVKATVLQFIKNYLEQTTVHGFKYVVTAASPVERIAWMGFVAIAFSAAFMMIGIYSFEAISNPITISLSTIPVAQVPFPAVSVDSGKSWDHMGYPRKALARTLPDESREGETERGLSNVFLLPILKWLF